MKAKKLPSGNWNCQVYLGKDQNGKRIIESVTAPTKKEAEYLAAERKLSASGKTETMTLRQAYNRYIAVKSKVLSPSTIKNYKLVAEHSTSQIMEKLVTKISSYDIQQAVNEYSAGHSPKSVKNRYGLFTAVMGMVLPEKKFYVKLPAQKKQEVYIPDPETIKRLYQKAKGTWIELPMLLASECGLRASEIAGLMYDCVGKDSITIKRAVVAAEKGYEEKSPKTFAGYRTIPCHPHILKLIGTGDGYVIPDYKRNHISMEWNRFISGTEEHYFSFHKLRHYFASKALLAGIPKRYVAELMGHSSEHMLDQIYEHTFASAKTDFAKRLVSETGFMFI